MFRRCFLFIPRVNKSLRLDPWLHRHIFQPLIDVRSVSSIMAPFADGNSISIISVSSNASRSRSPSLALTFSVQWFNLLSFFFFSLHNLLVYFLHLKRKYLRIWRKIIGYFIEINWIVLLYFSDNAYAYNIKFNKNNFISGTM